jgi:hypothetical protein
VTEGDADGVLFGRRRRANAPRGTRRAKRYEVTVSADEDRRLRARAEELGVTVPRLLFESALSVDSRPDTERKLAGAELFAIRRSMAEAVSVIVELARAADEPDWLRREVDEAVAEYRAIVPRLGDALRRLSGP